MEIMGEVAIFQFQSGVWGWMRWMRWMDLGCASLLGTLALQVVIELFFAGIAEFLCCIWLGRSHEGTELGKLNEAIYVNVYLGRTTDSRKKYY